MRNRITIELNSQVSLIVFMYNKSYKCGSKSMLMSLCILSNLSKAFREEKKNYTAPGEGKKVCIWDHIVTNHECG